MTWHVDAPYNLKCTILNKYKLLFLRNSGKLGSPKSLVSFSSVTDQLYSLSRKSVHGAPKELFIQERDEWTLFTAQEKVHGAPKEVYT